MKSKKQVHVPASFHKEEDENAWKKKNVGDKTKELLIECRDCIRNSSDKLLEAIAQGLSDLDKGWKTRLPNEQCQRFEKVIETVKEVLVSKCDGGGCEDEKGIALSTFNSYKSLAKKVHIHCARWQDAKSSSGTTANLIICTRYRRYKVGDDILEWGDVQKLGLKKYLLLKSKEEEDGKILTEADKTHLALLALNEARANTQPAKEKSTVWTLPCPDSFDEDCVLDEAINIVVCYFEHKGFSKLVNANTPEAQAVRRALGELNAYLKSKEADAA